MNNLEYYIGLFEVRKDVLNKCFQDSDCMELHLKTSQMVEDLIGLKDLFNSSCGPTYTQGCIELQLALESIVFGRYRHAYSSVRLSLELFLASIKFSTNEYEARLWQLGKRDISWKGLVSEENGLFSNDFFSCFASDISDYRKGYLSIISKVYRECSEFVHGNPHTHLPSSEEINFNKDLVIATYEKVETVVECIVFMIVSRFLYGFSTDLKNRYEATILDRLGHISEVRNAFNVGV